MTKAANDATIAVAENSGTTVAVCSSLDLILSIFASTWSGEDQSCIRLTISPMRYGDCRQQYKRAGFAWSFLPQDSGQRAQTHVGPCDWEKEILKKMQSNAATWSSCNEGIVNICGQSKAMHAYISAFFLRICTVQSMPIRNTLGICHRGMGRNSCTYGRCTFLLGKPLLPKQSRLISLRPKSQDDKSLSHQ